MKSLMLLPIGLICLAAAGYAADRVTIYDIQYTTDPSGNSPYQGQAVTVSGVVSAIFYDGYVIAEEAGPWHAIYVYTRRDGPQIGDEVEVAGTVIEYAAMTRIQNVTSYSLLSTGNPVAPAVVNAVTAAREMYESVLISVPSVTVTNLLGTGEWDAYDGTATIRCDDLNDYMYFPKIGDDLTSLTGALFYSSGMFKIEPRNTSDIAGEVTPHYALHGDVVTMNDDLAVLENVYLVIQGDRILGIESSQPQGIPITEIDGLIFPGLIDGHNHAVWNVLDLIPFNQTFNERYEWQATQMYANFRTQIYALRDYGGVDAQVPNIYKLAEVRALCAGTTMIQSTNCAGWQDDYFAHQGMVIGNVERFPSRVYDSVFPLRETQSFWTAKSGECWERFVIHLSEGTTASALQEFYQWQAWGMLDGRTTILHGIPYGPTEWVAMAAAGASLVWSPASNWYLYGASPDVPGALAAGVNVAIAPDWTESGCRDMLAEMKYGNELNHSIWGGVLTPLDFALFATRNAALAMGVQNRVGRLAVGFQADLMVIPGNPGDPYQALLDADQASVRLTVVSGRPMYGDPELLAQFPFLGDVEEITVCGRAKALAIQIDAFAIPFSDKPMSDVLLELEVAYDHASPRICAFLGPCYCAPSDMVESIGDSGRALRVWPNPLGAAATLSFSLNRMLPVRLNVYSADGGLMRTVLNQSLERGEHSTTWDGRNDAGSRVSSGVYFLRLECDGRTQATKILITR